MEVAKLLPRIDIRRTPMNGKQQNVAKIALMSTVAVAEINLMTPPFKDLWMNGV